MLALMRVAVVWMVWLVVMVWLLLVLVVAAAVPLAMPPRLCVLPCVRVTRQVCVCQLSRCLEMRALFVVAMVAPTP